MCFSDGPGEQVPGAWLHSTKAGGRCERSLRLERVRHSRCGWAGGRACPWAGRRADPRVQGPETSSRGRKPVRTGIRRNESSRGCSASYVVRSAAGLAPTAWVAFLGNERNDTDSEDGHSDWNGSFGDALDLGLGLRGARFEATHPRVGSDRRPGELAAETPGT